MRRPFPTPLRTPVLTTALLTLGLGFWACAQEPTGGGEDVRAARTTDTGGPAPAAGDFEVWLADQSDTRPGHGGQLLIFDGARLRFGAYDAGPVARIDLAEGTAELCRQQTGRNPVRPHMVLFNEQQTHAIVSFVASGHVVIFDAETREPLSCIETTLGSTGTRQAHAAFPAPDGSYILVANQNGKRLERIRTDYASNTFVHDPTDVLDLMTCTSLGGEPCEAPELRPINWPICPIIDASSRYAFVTLRGGGLFVVDAQAPQMQIVAAYDSATVRGNGCGGEQVGESMYINSGGSPVGVDDHHPNKFGFDVYRFPLSGYSPANPPNHPAPERLFSKSGKADSHGMAAAGGGRYLWVMDRFGDVAEILDLQLGQHAATVDLNGRLTHNAAPDLTHTSPAGDQIFVALRGPVPLSGDPHSATGASPGLGVIRLTEDGRSGSLVHIVRLTNPNQQPGQAPDAHGLRVRRR